MNTTSMEFVIAQNAIGKKNPSVLSEFMGISKNMEDALLVNPWNLGVCVFFFFSRLRVILDRDTSFSVLGCCRRYQSRAPYGLGGKSGST